MPYKSDAQRRFFHTSTARKEGITPGMTKEWDEASKGMKLPEHKAEGGEIQESEGTEEQLLNGVAQELLNGIEKKDKGMVCDAISALLSHLKSQDYSEGQE